MDQIKEHTALCGLKQPLSARWTHAEREGITVDKIGHADVSSWSSSTSKFSRGKAIGRLPGQGARPEVCRSFAHPEAISSLRAVASYYEAKARHVEKKWASEDVTGPECNGNTSEVAKAVKDCDKEIAASDSRLDAVDSVNQALVKLSGGEPWHNPSQEPFQVDLLADCEPSDLSTVKVSIEHEEPEAYPPKDNPHRSQKRK